MLLKECTQTNTQNKITYSIPFCCWLFGCVLYQDVTLRKIRGR